MPLDPLGALDTAHAFAEAYAQLYKGLTAVLKPAVKNLTGRANGDEPATEADREMLTLIGQILDVMDEAEQTASKGMHGDNNEDQGTRGAQASLCALRSD